VLVVVGDSVSWGDSWLDGGLAWLVSPFALESVSLWWLWGSFLSAAGGEISGADWLAVGGDPLIAGWKLCGVLDETNLFKLDIVSDWPWTIESTDLSAVNGSISCAIHALSVTIQTCAFWKFWGTSGKFFIVWC